MRFCSLLQILGGVLADRYGGDRVMTVSGFIWALATVSHPLLLSLVHDSSHQVKYHLLIVLRVVVGFFQGEEGEGRVVVFVVIKSDSFN